MLEELDSVIYEFGKLNNNDGYDEELDELVDKFINIVKNMNDDEISILLKKPYMKVYRESIDIILNNKED
ncbi:MAG: hypothetical protein IKH54_01700 [Bacilli bacterium]|nr:hypothetical protein [Bacilli bacterium]